MTLPRTKDPLPSNLVWLHGLVCGLAISAAGGLGESARADVEPTTGPFVAHIVQGVVFVLWLVLVSALMGWFTRREWVRDWFAAAERKG